jgi:hypothetical protein
MPGGVLLLMALLTVLRHPNDVDIAQPDLFWPAMGEMDPNVPELGGECCSMTILTADVAVIRAMHSTDVGCHFMAVGAAGSELRCVIFRRAEGTDNREDDE